MNVSGISLSTDMATLHRSSVHILLSDKDSQSRSDVLELLRRCSYKVTTVESARQAFEHLLKGTSSIDLILAEVELPNGKGYKMLKHIKKEERLKQIPVIMMSHHDEMSMVVKCLRLGAADFLVKPLRTNELLNLWTHMWRRKRAIGMNSSSRTNGLNINDVPSMDHLLFGDTSESNTGSTDFFSDDTEERRKGDLVVHNNEIGSTVVQRTPPKEDFPEPSPHLELSLKPLSETLDLTKIDSNSKKKIENKVNSSPVKTADPSPASQPIIKRNDLKIGKTSAFLNYAETNAKVNLGLGKSPSKTGQQTSESLNNSCSNPAMQTKPPHPQSSIAILNVKEGSQTKTEDYAKQPSSSTMFAYDFNHSPWEKSKVPSLKASNAFHGTQPSTSFLKFDNPKSNSNRLSVPPFPRDEHVDMASYRDEGRESMAASVSSNFDSSLEGREPMAKDGGFMHECFYPDGMSWVSTKPMSMECAKPPGYPHNSPYGLMNLPMPSDSHPEMSSLLPPLPLSLPSLPHSLNHPHSLPHHGQPTIGHPSAPLSVHLSTVIQSLPSLHAPPLHPAAIVPGPLPIYHPLPHEAACGLNLSPCITPPLPLSAHGIPAPTHFSYYPAAIPPQSGHPGLLGPAAIPPWPTLQIPGSERKMELAERREAALNKFRHKRKDRCFEKKIRYVSRKRLAEQRPRNRGQFVRQSEKNSGGKEEDEEEEEEEEDEEEEEEENEPSSNLDSPENENNRNNNNKSNHLNSG